MAVKLYQNPKEKRKLRVRSALSKSPRPRLCVFRSNRHLFAQIIDNEGRVLLALGDEKIKDDSCSGVSRSHLLGKTIADEAVKKGIKEVVFDRGSYLYHGNVKALADGAREGGLSF